MRRALIIIIFALSSILYFSCHDEFSLEAQFKPRNILSCIIRPDTSLQVVSLSTSYQGEGQNPYIHTEPPAIIGADVKMWFDNDVYQFRDTSLARNDTSRYNLPVNVYYNNELKPTEGGIVEVEALLPNGLLLTSLTQIPDVSGVSFALSDTLVPPAYGRFLELNWTNIGELIYDPKLVIVYFNRIDHQKYETEIPLNYFENGEEFTPNYPIASVKNSLVFEMNAIDRTMAEISEGDPDKTNYAITEIKLKVMVFDENLSAYYSSVQQFLDGFTIKVDQPDFSNVEGGFGIFGSYNVTEYNLKIDENYVDSFGYIVGFGD
ncbi:DUF4249 family protein [Bacteroidota bacterium]